MFIRYEMPFLPPSVNACYRSYGNRVVKSAKLKVFEQEIIRYFDSQEEEITMLEGKLKLTVSFYLKGRRSIDIDNLLKALLDGMENILFENDKMIFEIHAEKFSNCDSAKTVILLEQLIEDL
jgi:Holliday junction resolvase RusA-like endonuclease